MRVAGLDLGGSSVKAWVTDGGRVVAEASVPVPTVRPAPYRAELEPAVWEAAALSALTQVVQQAGPGEWAGLTVSSLRQGFVLLDAAGGPLGNGVLNSDRRGAPHAGVLAGRHALTGHWPAPELTLPKLLAVQADEPDRWAATARVLFVHDWVVWLLTGEQATEASYACAGGMADVAARTWATGLLEECGVGTGRLAPVVEPGTRVGVLQPARAAAVGLPAGLPVVAGCGDTQLAAVGSGGLGDGVVTVVAGSSTPVQLSSAAPLHDPLGRPWVSTHAAPDRWAAEGNAGYPGTFQGWWRERPQGEPDDGGVVAVTAAPYWAQETWEHQPPTSLVGLRPDTTDGQVAWALAQAHAFAVAGGVEDLERVLGRTASAVVVCGGGAGDGVLPRLLADVLGRDVHVAQGQPAAVAGTCLVTGAPAPGLSDDVVPAGDPGRTAASRTRWRHVTDALRAALPGA